MITNPVAQVALSLVVAVGLIGLTPSAMQAQAPATHSALSNIIALDLRDPFVTLAPGEKRLSAAAGSYALQVASNETWSITGMPGWVEVSPAQGEGNRAVLVSVSGNPGAEERSALLHAGGATHRVVQGGQERALLLAGDLDFGSVSLAQAQVLPFDLINPGGVSVLVAAIEVPPGFAVVAGFSGGILPAGATRRCWIRFAPLQKGTFMGEIVVRANTPQLEHRIACAGVGQVPLAAPNRPRVGKDVSLDSIPVHWDPVEDAEGYRLYRHNRIQPLGASLLAELATTGHEDTQVHPGVVYHYWVSAFRGTEESAKSLSDHGYLGELHLTITSAAQVPGTQQVKITYELTAPPDHALSLSVDGAASGFDFGTLPMHTVSGAVGDGLQSGPGTILWEMGEDWPNQFAEAARFRLRGPEGQPEAISQPTVLDTRQAEDWGVLVWADFNKNGVYDPGEGIAGAEVYVGGRTAADLVGLTGPGGVLGIDLNPYVGMPLFARHALHHEPAVKANHEGVDHRMFTLWLDSDIGYPNSPDWDGTWLSVLFSAEDLASHQPGQSTLLQLAHPVFEWHLVVASETADSAFLASLQRGFAAASTYLYDVTDGQMTFGRVQILGGVSRMSTAWTSADMVVFDQPEFHPRAAFDGVSLAGYFAMFFGTTWAGVSPDHSNYYNAIVHEFGHYALRLWDEYLDGNYNKDAWKRFRQQNPHLVPTNYGLMDYPYTLPELSSWLDYLPAYTQPVSKETVSYHIWEESLRKSNDFLPCWAVVERRFNGTYGGYSVRLATPPPGHYLGYDERSARPREGPHTIPAPYRIQWVGGTESAESARKPSVRLKPAAGSATLAPLLVLRDGWPLPGATVLHEGPAGATRRLGRTDDGGRLAAVSLTEGDLLVVQHQQQSLRMGTPAVDPVRRMRVLEVGPMTQAVSGKMAMRAEAAADSPTIITRLWFEQPDQSGTVALKVELEFPAVLDGPPTITLHLEDGQMASLSVAGAGHTFTASWIEPEPMRGLLEFVGEAGSLLWHGFEPVGVQLLHPGQTFPLRSHDGRLECFVSDGLHDGPALAAILEVGDARASGPESHQRELGAVFHVAFAPAAMTGGFSATLNGEVHPDPEAEASTLSLFDWLPHTGTWETVPAATLNPLGPSFSLPMSGDRAFALFAQPLLDTTPPAAITDLAAQPGTTFGSVILTWTAPGDDGSEGMASAYEVRMSTDLIDESVWDDAIQVPAYQAPQPAGSAETLAIHLPNSGALYHFAVRAIDAAGNMGPFSPSVASHTYELDSDGDGLPDWWEILHFGGATAADANTDPDGDGLSNLEEYLHGTDPHNWDTDGDGMSDDYEVEHGLDPLDPADTHLDLDGDGLTNLEEYRLGTAASRFSTMNDGLPDGWKVKHGLDPLASSRALSALGDLSGDGISNLLVYALGADPRSPVPAALHTLVVPSQVAADGARFTVRWREVAGIQWRLEYSTDMRAWSPVHALPAGMLLPEGPVQAEPEGFRSQDYFVPFGAQPTGGFFRMAVVPVNLP